MLHKQFTISGFLMLIGMMTNAQTDTFFLKKTILFQDYIEAVRKNNIAYAAEQFNVNIAEANIESAKISPDPALNVGWFDNGQRRMNMGYGYSAGLDYTLELGGKRKARIDLARNEVLLTQYLLQDYFRNLRADASIQYFEAMRMQQLVKVMLSSYEAMHQLAISDSIRAKLGSITDVDARQSRLEAATMLNNVYQAIADWKVSLSKLSLFLGRKQNDTLVAATAGLFSFNRSFIIADLLTSAQNSRADLKAALQSNTVSKKALALAKANRVIDLGLNAGLTYSSYVRNIIAPTPSFTQTSAGISIPLKFSNRHAGELEAARHTSQQSDVQYQQAELQVQSEVMQSWYNFQAMQKQVQQFNTGLLREAKLILDGKVYSYKRGETTLLEVLNAQRTYNDVQQNYYQTLFNHAVALVELERAAAIWDLKF